MSGPGEVVAAGLERLNADDFDGYYALMGEDIVSTNELGTLTGKAQFTAGTSENFTMLSEHWRRVEKMAVSGNYVATWLTFGCVTAESGQRCEVEGCTVWEVQDGLIRSIREIFDWRPLLTALGMDGPTT
jgi:ketosteroid isomerase-like protein